MSLDRADDYGSEVDDGERSGRNGWGRKVNFSSEWILFSLSATD